MFNLSQLRNGTLKRYKLIFFIISTVIVSTVIIAIVFTIINAEPTHNHDSNDDDCNI
ncbi:hypothetical protein LCGC14_0689090 [marine sediment metagenome]|uniref:Uncharacterized protein n=1 Tax=marine sediment metagenome TaxID=412755 RepID=A0A0F9TTZ0_9ZZZZ